MPVDIAPAAAANWSGSPLAAIRARSARGASGLTDRIDRNARLSGADVTNATMAGSHPKEIAKNELPENILT
jgi:hypothetical protein